MLIVPLLFLVGAMFSAYFVDHKIALGKNPRYDFLLTAISSLMLFVSVAGYKGVFGIFGESYNNSVDFFLLSLLAMAMGIQNASMTSASGAVIRTTHLTGVTTDLGIGLVRILSPAVPYLVREQELRATRMRIGIILSFIFGSATCAFVFLQISYLGFLIPAVTSLAVLYFARASAQSVLKLQSSEQEQVNDRSS
jgi:uncharacterized membrane protein YoaK (UPF0700 family)